MKQKLFKSNIGLVFAVIYLLLILSAIIEGINMPPHAMSGLAMLILTAPWSFIFLVMLETLGVVTKENYPALYALITFGGLINAFILYLLGSLVTKLFEFIFSRNKSQ